MKNLIFCAFAVDADKNTGANIKNNKHHLDVYYKNLCVALKSAKIKNSDDDVALISNAILPDEIESFFNRNEILFYNVAFDKFVFPNNYKWGLAFYKICALNFVAKELSYDKFALIDCDVFVQSSLDCIWQECSENILLYDIEHGLQVSDYKAFLEDVYNFPNTGKYITHYGGEFAAFSKKMISPFLNSLSDIYNYLISNHIEIKCGDETLLSLAAYFNNNLIKNAGAYIYRFWTGTFRLVSTRHIKNQVLILHLPDEKDDGLIKLYNYFNKGKHPTNKCIYKVCHLQHPSLKVQLKIFAKKMFKHRT